MPVQIGAKPESNFSDPIGLLGDCHRRIERFLQVLVECAAKISGDIALTEGERKSLDNALRYFREAAPKHTADEEESLFPRLRELNDPAVIRMLAETGKRLEADHESAHVLHLEVDRLGLRFLDSGALEPELAARFAALVQDLAKLYKAHIAVEDGEVFPLAARVLGTTDRQAIGQEMAARRGAN